MALPKVFVPLYLLVALPKAYVYQLIPATYKEFIVSNLAENTKAQNCVFDQLGGRMKQHQQHVDPISNDFLNSSSFGRKQFGTEKWKGDEDEDA